MKDLYQRWLEQYAKDSEGKDRFLGVEIEYSNLSLNEASSLIQRLYGGQIVDNGRYDKSVVETRHGDFHLELDAILLKNLEEKNIFGQLNVFLKDVADDMDQLVNDAAEKIVPYEIAAPPVPFHKLEEMEELVRVLRREGALGTTHALQYAFGVHLNIQPPDLRVQTVLSFFRAFIILQDWIEKQSELDMTRKITPFINDYPKDYLKLILNPDYQPDEESFIRDYIEHNPTRNRAMDMLPILAMWDEALVKELLPNEKNTPRPTFHYRLPNSKIDLFRWNLRQEVGLWVPVEILAHDPQKLRDMGEHYRHILDELLPDKQKWTEYLHRCVIDLL